MTATASAPAFIPAPSLAGSPAFHYDVGIVGLSTALAFHAAGRRVLGFDVNEQRLENIQACRADLLDSDRARLRTSLAPRGAGGGLRPEQRPESAGRGLCGHRRQVLALTWMTYVGTTADLLVGPLAARGLRAGVDIAVAFSPERIDPGNDRHSHEAVPRVVGGATPDCTDKAAQALAGYALDVHQVSSAGAAEMTKKRS